MAMSDLLFPICAIPHLIQVQYVDSWLIGGPLGQVFCKLFAFLPNTSSIQSLVLIAVDRFGSVIYPLRSLLIRSKVCPFSILATWIVAIAVNSLKFMACKLVFSPEKLVCERRLNKIFRESSSYEHYILFCIVVFSFNPFLLIAILYIIIHLKLKSPKNPLEQLANGGNNASKESGMSLRWPLLLC